MELLNDNELILVSGGKTKSECKDDLMKATKKIAWDVVGFVLDGVKFYGGVIMVWNALVSAIGYGCQEDSEGASGPNDYRLPNPFMAAVKKITELK